MNTNFTIETFSLPGTSVHIPAVGNASLLHGLAIEDPTRGPHQGYLLRVFRISSPDDVHPQWWEMHPAGDEFLFMLTGALGIEGSDGSDRSSSLLEAGHGLVMPKGLWHRLELREPGLLLALSPPLGTELSQSPGGSHER